MGQKNSGKAFFFFLLGTQTCFLIVETVKCFGDKAGKFLLSAYLEVEIQPALSIKYFPQLFQSSSC